MQHSNTLRRNTMSMFALARCAVLCWCVGLNPLSVFALACTWPTIWQHACVRRSTTHDDIRWPGAAQSVFCQRAPSTLQVLRLSYAWKPRVYKGSVWVGVMRWRGPTWWGFVGSWGEAASGGIPGKAIWRACTPKPTHYSTPHGCS